jgi:RimJ/RimL family protein N-acetyltransferase
MMIQSPRLILRSLSAADLEDFLAYRSDPEVLRYQGMGPMDREKATAFIEEMANLDLHTHAIPPGKWLQIGIELTDSKKLIGDLALKFDAYEPRIAEIGFTLNPAYQRQGFGTEAATNLIQYLFTEKNTHRIIALTDVRNPASYRLLEKLGFRREAHYRKSYFDKMDGDWFDEYRYGLLGEDWK